jgi:hypothetical protein
MLTYSDIFIKKIGRGMHSDPKFSRRMGGVSHIDASISHVR